MAIKNSGSPLAITEIVDEFGGSTPHSLSEYYRDGGSVPGNNTSVSTSGTISMNMFYGCVNEIGHVHSSLATNQNYATIFGSNWASAVPKRITINSGVTIGATGSNYAMTIPSGMGGTLIIDNAGTIEGYGGAAGGNGGTSIHVSSAGVTINNTGVIRAGGGGGANGGDGGAGGNGSYSSFSHNTTSTGSCSPYNHPFLFRGQNYPQVHNYNGDQLCSICHGGQASGQGSSVMTANGTTGHNFQWGKTLTGQNWRDYSRRYWYFANSGCSIYTDVSTSGGAGGTGGTGGVGQGYNQSAGSSNAGGSGASAGGTNAGAGGDGGASGAGGAFGASGSAGSAGSTGANGNVSNGASGASAGSAGTAGHYLFKNSVTVTLNNTGTVSGLIN